MYGSAEEETLELGVAEGRGERNLVLRAHARRSLLLSRHFPLVGRHAVKSLFESV